MSNSALFEQAVELVESGNYQVLNLVYGDHRVTQGNENQLMFIYVENVDRTVVDLIARFNNDRWSLSPSEIEGLIERGRF
jgi:hypothetical protein